MRGLTIVVLLLSPPLLGIGQSSPQENLERLVRGALDPKSDLAYDGFAERSLNRSGDGAAVAITKAVGGKDLNADDIERILLLIGQAFAAPKIIENEPDREPRTTLFVLKYLSTLPVSPELKKRIRETKELVEHSTKLATGSKPKP